MSMSHNRDQNERIAQNPHDKGDSIDKKAGPELDL